MDRNYMESTKEFKTLCNKAPNSGPESQMPKDPRTRISPVILTHVPKGRT